MSYLSDRYQYCSLNGCRSTAKKVTCGIPQGSCLSPLLFIIYLNDFESCLQFSKANLYADDTETTISSSDIGDLIRSFETELDNISNWMRDNKLSLRAGTPQCDEEQQQVCAKLRNIYIFLNFAHICCCSSSHCGVPALKLINELSSSDPTSDIGIVSFSFSIYLIN